MEKEAASTILASWAKGTLRQYNSCLKAWQKFCSETDYPLTPNEISVINFLSFLKLKGLGFASISSHKSALLSFFQFHSEETRSLQSSALLARFMKGLFREVPPKTKYATTWDPEQVLSLLESWPENKELTLKKLSLKLCFLLSICSPRRVSEIAHLSLDHLQKDAQTWTFFLEYRNKNRSAGPAHKAIYEAFNDNHIICPLRCLAEYVRRTQTLREGEPQLLISHTNFKAISSSTVARWIKSILELAGINSSFGAHSTRSASASKAVKAGLPISAVMRAASWSHKANTFHKFYWRDVETHSFQASVLTKCVKEAIMMCRYHVI